MSDFESPQGALFVSLVTSVPSDTNVTNVTDVTNSSVPISSNSDSQSLAKRLEHRQFPVASFHDREALSPFRSTGLGRSL